MSLLRFQRQAPESVARCSFRHVAFKFYLHTGVQA